MSIRVLLFDADGNDTELPFEPRYIQRPTKRQLLWVDIEKEALHFAVVLGGLGLSTDTLAQLERPQFGPPTLTQHERYLRLNVNAACSDGSFTPVSVVAGDNFIVTSHPDRIESISNFMQQMQGDTQLGQLDSAAFLVVLLSRLLETYLDQVGQIEESTDQLDEVLLQAHYSREPLKDLVELRREVGELRRRLAAHRPVYMHLASPDFVVYAGDEREAQFTTLLSQFEHTLENVSHSRDLILGSFDLYMTSLSQRTNDIMRVLTVVTLALGILAAVAGLMGMNFQADIFKSGNTGFRDVLLGSALGIALIISFMRWRKWL